HRDVSQLDSSGGARMKSRRRANSNVGWLPVGVTLLEHAEQKSPPIHSLNIPDQLVSSPGRLPAPHNLRLNPVLRYHRSLLYARTRLCHFDRTETRLPPFIAAIRFHTQKYITALAVNNDRRLRMVHRP